jgi:hypothetical protein
MTNDGLEEILLSAVRYWLFSACPLAATIPIFYHVEVVCGVVV